MAASPAAPAGAAAPAAAEARPLNVNVGLLGHVDCGKTSLAAALSTTLSTAALDKHPQSRQRGITLDLGFSSFSVPLPEALRGPGSGSSSSNELQFTLVDCPGHASLIRTIIGGAQIIDLMLLVVDVTKGIQAQTAECLVVGEIAARELAVVLNKVDLLPEGLRAKGVKRAAKLLHEALAATKFAGAQVIPVSTKPDPLGIDELKAWLVSRVVQQHQAQVQQQQHHQQLPGSEPGRVGQSDQQAQAQAPPFLFAVDHCFPLKGQGTVLTGTVLQGSCAINDTIELPALKLQRQVKSLQVFHRPVGAVGRGDRAALCVTQLDAKLLERGLAAAPGAVPTFAAAVAVVHKVRFFPGPVPGRAKYHLSIGHATLMADATFFGLPDGQGVSEADALQQLIDSLSKASLAEPQQPPQHGSSGSGSISAGGGSRFDWSQQYLYQDQLYGLEGRPAHASAAAAAAAAAAAGAEGEARHHGRQWALLRFEQPVTAPEDAMVIGARFDADPSGEACRLAFYGCLAGQLGDGGLAQLARLRVFKPKERAGVIERFSPDGASAICRGLFKKESDLSSFAGAAVVTGRGEAARVEGRFGLSGKVKLVFEPPLPPASLADRSAADNAVALSFKRFVFDQQHRGGAVQQ